MFKGLANLGAILKQAQQLSGQMGQMTEGMKKRRVTGAAAGGMVEIEMNGMMEALGCRIEPRLFARNDRELIEDLVVAAVNQAILKGKQMHADAVRELTGGLPLPFGIQEALAKFSVAEEGEEESEARD